MNASVPPAAPPDASGASEEAAWADLRARWGDEAAHRAFLDRFGDLPGLARAGARYRGVLEGAPDDATARKGRDEVLRRATAMALAATPRQAARSGTSPGRRRALLLLVVLLAGVAATAGLALLRTLGTR